jgi:hypothetical protein
VAAAAASAVAAAAASAVAADAVTAPAAVAAPAASAVAADAVASAAVAAAAATVAASAAARPKRDVRRTVGAGHFKACAGGGRRSSVRARGTKQHRAGQHAGAHRAHRGVADRKQ